MSQFGSYPYLEEPKFQAVRLGYRTSQLGMYIFLPAKDSSLPEFQQNLCSAAWDKWIGQFETVEGHIRLPRFRLNYQANLKGVLEKLGMGIAFNRQRARFDTIHCPPPELWIDQVLHRAVGEVNETGTEASAVTSSGIGASLAPRKPVRSFKMIVDRPFFFAIRNDITDIILFMGAVEEPGLSEIGLQEIGARLEKC
jgi:serine protease inhibitor